MPSSELIQERLAHGHGLLMLGVAPGQLPLKSQTLVRLVLTQRRTGRVVWLNSVTFLRTK